MPPKGLRRPEGMICDLTEARGVKLYYEVFGPNRAEWQGEKEEALFMLLGSAADLRKTADQQYVNQSVSMFKVIAYDHRNTGRSTIKDEPCTMEDYADDAAALLQAVLPADRVPVSVIGISFGGMVAQHLAIRHPHLIKKLVLCCCATGGQGGMSFPIHDWYAPGVTVEDRVTRKIFQANTDRTEEWREKSPSQWQMSFELLSRDEKVGIDEPLRAEGVRRQLEARKAHDTWDQIGQLSDMEVLLLGSSQDNITPPELMERMAHRIGGPPRCEAKLDFTWGHSFVAADTAAMPYVNAWIRRPPLPPPLKLPGGIVGTGRAASSTVSTLAAALAPAIGEATAGGHGAATSTAVMPSAVPGQVWKVVGGSDKGGIIVRSGAGTGSAMVDARLATGALVEQLALKGDRINYRLLKGDGPATGWVAMRISGGKELVVRAAAEEVAAAAAAAV